MVVLVTGASRGIGKAISQILLMNDIQVIGTTTNLDNVADSLSIQWFEVDFNNKASFDRFIIDIKQIGPLDGIVNNAGVNIIKPLDSIQNEDIDKVFNVNLLKPFQICSSLARKLVEGGKIVNVASIWSVISKEKRTLYTTAKSGLAGMTRALAVELGSRNILVNTISPGFVLTDLTSQSLSQDEMEVLSAKIPIKRMAEPNEIAELVNFMISPKNTYMTGQNIVIDGGFSIV